MFGSNVEAEIKNYVGVDDTSYVGEFESPEIVKLRAIEKAKRNAQEQAGVYLSSYSKMSNKREFEILDREFLSNRKVSAGNRLYYRGRYAEAIKAGNDALRLNRGNRNALFLRGVSRVALKQYQPAVSDYDKLIASTPDNPLLYVLRGFAYRAIGERKKAQADFAKARELGYNPQ